MGYREREGEECNKRNERKVRNNGSIEHEEGKHMKRFRGMRKQNKATCEWEVLRFQDWGQLTHLLTFRHSSSAISNVTRRPPPHVCPPTGNYWLLPPVISRSDQQSAWRDKRGGRLARRRTPGWSFLRDPDISGNVLSINVRWGGGRWTNRWGLGGGIKPSLSMCRVAHYLNTLMSCDFKL